MAAEEAHDHAIGFSRFGNVGIIEELVKESLPNMQLGVHPEFDELLVGVHCRTHRERPCTGNDKRGRKFRQHFW
jgi:hypothetical protein